MLGIRDTFALDKTLKMCYIIFSSKTMASSKFAHGV